MKLDASLLAKDQWIIPDWKIGDQDNRACEEPIKLRIKPVKGGEFALALRELDKLRKEGSIEKQAKLRDKLIADHVLEVQGLDVVKGDGEAFSPKNGKEFIEALSIFDAVTMQGILDDLLNTICSANRLEEALLERYASRSTS